MATPLIFLKASRFLYVTSLLFLQLSFSENGSYNSSEEKEKVAAARTVCYGKEIGFGSQSMKIAEASSRLVFRFLKIVQEMERCFRYRALP